MFVYLFNVSNIDAGVDGNGLFVFFSGSILVIANEGRDNNDIWGRYLFTINLQELNFYSQVTFNMKDYIYLNISLKHVICFTQHVVHISTNLIMQWAGHGGAFIGEDTN